MFSLYNCPGCQEREIKGFTGAGRRCVKWARDNADWLDPLTAKEDELWGKANVFLTLSMTKIFRGVCPGCDLIREITNPTHLICRAT